MKTTDTAKTRDIFDVYHSTCLKGVAIIMLLIHHSFMSPKRYRGQSLTFLLVPEHSLNELALFFKICVSLFAFISAYAIAKKMMTLPVSDGQELKTSLKNLMISRTVKLLGAFIFVFLLISLFSAFYEPGRFAKIYGTSFPGSLEFYLLDMLGLAELLSTPTFIATFWYYSLALVIIAVCPLMYLLAKKIGPLPFLALMGVVNFAVAFRNDNIWHYVLCISVGVVCAMENIITKLTDFRLLKNPALNKALKLVLEAALLYVLMLAREGALKAALYPLWDAIIPVAVTAFCCEFLFQVPVLRQTLAFLGKYSANIFLVHNFIRSTWFHDFIYSFRYPMLILAILMGISLVLSILIELLKKLLRYNQLLDRLTKFLQTVS